MKWILFGIGALAALVGIVAAVGSMLPRNHTASRTLRVSRPPADVWTAVIAATAASSVPVDVVESHPPSRLVTRVKETEHMFGGTWTIAIAADPSTGPTPGRAASASAKRSRSSTRCGSNRCWHSSPPRTGRWSSRGWRCSRAPRTRS